MAKFFIMAILVALLNGIQLPKATESYPIDEWKLREGKIK
jgi:hypothetical protein